MQPNKAAPAIKAPQVTTPSGGGAIKSISEPFKSQDFTGSAGFGIPFPLPAARGFTPSVSLQYSSGGGSGVFGLGFSVDQLSISRKTADGVPYYDERDVFMLSGAELVPAYTLNKEGQWKKAERTIPENGITYNVYTFKPRVEGSFSLIEQWVDAELKTSFWKILTTAGQTHYLGLSENGRICNPEQPQHIFEWLVELSTDPHGNKIEYIYKPEDAVNIPAAIYNAGRDHTTQRYLWQIRYGNYFNTGVSGNEVFAFTVRFDYGQINPQQPDDPETSWEARPDPFSHYKAGFEVRTYRRCRGIYLQHLFTEENSGKPFTTQALIVVYRQSEYSNLSLTESVHQRGYKINPDGLLWMQDMPPVTLHYQPFEPERQVWQTLDIHAPGYFNPTSFMAVDLYGKGIDGFLLSNDTYTGWIEPLGRGKFKEIKPVDHFPVYKDFSGSDLAFTSLEGNSVLDLVVAGPGNNGFFAGDEDTWKPFEPFQHLPVDFNNPDKEWVDVDGSGKAAVVMFDAPLLKHYTSRGKLGYNDARYTRLPGLFPAVNTGGEQELIGFSDFLGDGLSHRYRLTDGRLEIWPNLGHGRFGEAIAFNNAPVFNGQFDAKRILLLDTDGSGATDILWLSAHSVTIWFNQNGNAFSNPVTLPLPAAYSPTAQVTVGDVTGYGTASLIFTQASPVVQHFYYDFSGSIKPYLIGRSENGVGGTTILHYTTSVLEQLADEQEGRKWPVRLPFPVHVIQQLETVEEISGARYIQRYRYHDGYYDPYEREFRGFGYVETWDTDTYENFTASAALSKAAAALLDKNLWSAPVYTRSWFLTGAYMLTPEICRQYSEEYYSGDAQAWQIAPFELSAEMAAQDAESIQQAYAALAGHAIRTEVYAADFTDLRNNPYTVSQTTTRVRLMQPRLEGKYCVVLTEQVNSLNYNYERNPADPQISQSCGLLFDEFGNALLSAALAYPRRGNPDLCIYPEQQHATCIVSQTDYINAPAAITGNNWQYIGIGWQEKSFETGGLSWPANAPFATDDLLRQVTTALQNTISAKAGTGLAAWSRMLAWQRSFYWNEDETAAMKGGEINSLALLHHSEVLEFVEGDVKYLLNGTATPQLLEQQGGYVYMDDGWWNTGLIQYYHREAGRFYMPYKTANTEAAEQSKTVGNGLDVKTTSAFDTYMMNITSVTTHLSQDSSLSSNAVWDYQALQPWQITDANNNVNQFLFDPLGRVVVQSVMGTVNGQPVGDNAVSGYTVYPHPAFDDVVTHPEKYLQECTSFFYYDVHAWQNKTNPQPVNAVAIGRTRHVNDPEVMKAAQDKTLIKIAVTYTDGLGRTIQSKARVGPGPLTLQKKDGVIITPHANDKADIVTDRWLVSGRTVYDNKGHVVEKYEPFFSATPYLESQQEIIDQQLVPPPAIMRYDAVGRVIRTDSPKGYFSKVTFTPWESAAYDFNDTILDSAYYKNFIKNYPEKPNLWQQEAMYALQQAIPCYNTPAITIHDNRGNTIRTIASNLGAITAAGIPAQVIPQGYNSQSLWQSLVDEKFLTVDATNSSTAWVSSGFKPYTTGFSEQFSNIYGVDSLPLQDWLTQACITTLHVYDIQGREIMNADARLFLKMVRSGELVYNCTMVYAFGGALMYSYNVDAGEKWILGNIYGNAFQSLDSRGFSISITYDRMQRTLSKRVTGGDGKRPLNNITELIVYGDDLPHAADANLRGNVYQHYDDAGLNTIQAYGLGNLPLQYTTQLRADYKTEANWQQPEQQLVQQATAYTFAAVYNAGNQVTEQTLPDGTKTYSVYDVAGRLAANQQRVNNTAAATIVNQAVIVGQTYNANGQTTRVFYGNGSQTLHEYDAITRQLVRTHTRRMAANDKTAYETIQDLYYTYDPNGNLCSVMDGASQVVYHNNQKVIPKNRYSYDPLYRLTEATGRMLPHLNSGKGNTAPDYTLTPVTNAADLQKLENYTQQYSYDFAANLLVKKHIANSGNHTQLFEYSSNANRLLNTRYGTGNQPARAPLAYDASGNLLTLEQGSTSVVAWNYRDNIAHVTQIVRETGTGTLNDTEYYVYDSSGARTRKVTERVKQGGATLELTDKIVMGGYEITRTYLLPVNKTHTDDALPAPQSERISIKTASLITHVWTIVDPVMGQHTAGDIQFRFQLHDPLDSVTIELTDDASLLTFEQYFPYGGTSFMLARSNIEAASKEYRFCGKERDAATGLYYYGARYYSTILVRWMCPDPAGTADGLNLYLYVGSNPIGYNDPTGMMQEHAAEYITTNKLKIKPYKKQIDSRQAVMRYINNTNNPKEHRNGLWDAWSQGREGILHAIPKPVDLIEYPRAKAKRLENINGLNLDGYDSDVHNSMDVEEKVGEKRKRGTLGLIRPTSKINREAVYNAPILTVEELINVGRQAVKNNKYKLFPLVVEFGNRYIEFAEGPYKNDIYSYPLVKIDGQEVYKRKGNMTKFSYRNIVLQLEVDEKDEEEKKKQEFEVMKPIFEFFKGVLRDDYSQGQIEAIAAIICDFLKGSAAIDYVNEAYNSDSPLTAQAMFSGKTPVYAPALTDGGRALVVLRTAANKKKKVSADA